MDPDTLKGNITTAYQRAADILGITYLTATLEEQTLIKELSQVKIHHQEWFDAIGTWPGFTGKNRI